jgi:quinol monooxygenase YgiN
MTTCCPVVELRQYTLHPGMRDQLIELFEREFVESQEEVGMRVIGTFRDLENPDRFVWLRGFQDMTSRAAQLQRFYGGSIWKAHRDAANVTMINSDNVLLLRPITTQSGFNLAGIARAARDSKQTNTGVILATIYHLSGDAEEFAKWFNQDVAPRLRETDIPILGAFVTEHHPNTFPALPVREDANVFVWFTRSADRAEYDRSLLGKEVSVKVSERIKANPEMLFLVPTARSLLRT